MSLNSKRTRPLVGLLAGLGVVAAGGIAEAATVQLSTGVLLVKQSSNETVKRGTGAGILMPRLESLGGNKLMAIWMDSAPDSVVPKSNAGDNNGYWEGKLSIIQLNAEAAPTIVTTQQFTSFSGDRPFNHPRLAAGMGGDYVIIAFASTLEDPDTTNEYVMGVDSTGTVIPLTGKSLNGDSVVKDSDGNLQQVLNIGQDDGDNHGASDIMFSGQDSAGVDHFLGTYQHNNNDIYAYSLAVTRTATGGVTVNQSWKTKIVTPANIGRGTCAVTGTGTATCCSAKGNNRPPEIGIRVRGARHHHGQGPEQRHRGGVQPGQQGLHEPTDHLVPRERDLRPAGADVGRDRPQQATGTSSAPTPAWRTPSIAPR